LTTIAPNTASGLDDPYMMSRGDATTLQDPGHAHFDVSLNDHMHNEGGMN